MKRIPALLLLVVLPCSQSFAWGYKGHRIVADIALNHLSSSAKQNLQTLLGNTDLAMISTWADEVRPQRPESYGWHFVDIPKDSAGFSEERDCYRPDEKRPSSQTDHHNCVVDRITLFKQMLADKNASQPDRLEALKFLVHFVGDIHQPMHAVDEARGGNGIHIVEFGSAQCGKYPCNLHSEWDTGLIEHTGRSEQEYVAFLEQMIVSKKLQAGGTPQDWANESLRLAKQVWVNDGGAVDQAYYQANISVVDERLALAGLRLAAMLNDALGRATT
ncbi:MAG TPA: S1/P1 nuclease [Candidatus Angelobacter sp.]|nr:S1/P1 nuclease [Candidatus Angelobacter sp.]